jgi:hypothetical protein
VYKVSKHILLLYVRSHYEGSTYHHEAGSNGGSAYNGGASRGEKSDRYAPPSSIPASSPANSVTGG